MERFSLGSALQGHLHDAIDAATMPGSGLDGGVGMAAGGCAGLGGAAIISAAGSVTAGGTDLTRAVAVTGRRALSSLVPHRTDGLARR